VRNEGLRALFPALTIRLTSLTAIPQEEHSYRFRKYPLATGAKAVRVLSLLHQKQLASPPISNPPIRKKDSTIERSHPESLICAIR
jgi:hypothetical protein